MKRPIAPRPNATEAQRLAEDACALATATMAKFGGIVLGETQQMATASDLVRRGDHVRAVGVLRTVVDKLGKLHSALGGAR